MPTMTPARMRVNTLSRPACVDAPDVMFPAVDSALAGRANAGERAALAVCRACPILARCREESLAAQLPFGVAGGLTVADRRAMRASRRRLTAAVPAEQDSPSESPANPRTLATPAAPATRVVAPPPPPGLGAGGQGQVAGSESALESVLAGQHGCEHGADLARVRELLAGRGTAAASRWEVALAAAAVLRVGRSVSGTARMLGEQYSQVKRWRDRDLSGQPLVQGGPGAGTRPLARPTTNTPTTNTPAPAAAATVGAAAARVERGAA